MTINSCCTVTDTVFFRNFGKFLQCLVASQPKRTQSVSSPPWESQISQNCWMNCKLVNSTYQDRNWKKLRNRAFLGSLHTHGYTDVSINTAYRKVIISLEHPSVALSRNVLYNSSSARFRRQCSFGTGCLRAQATSSRKRHRTEPKWFTMQLCK
jgi:hypothetical protein